MNRTARIGFALVTGAAIPYVLMAWIEADGDPLRWPLTAKILALGLLAAALISTMVMALAEELVG